MHSSRLGRIGHGRRKGDSDLLDRLTCPGVAAISVMDAARKVLKGMAVVAIMLSTVTDAPSGMFGMNIPASRSSAKSRWVLSGCTP